MYGLHRLDIRVITYCNAMKHKALTDKSEEAMVEIARATNSNTAMMKSLHVK